MFESDLLTHSVQSVVLSRLQVSYYTLARYLTLTKMSTVLKFQSKSKFSSIILLVKVLLLVPHVYPFVMLLLFSLQLAV